LDDLGHSGCPLDRSGGRPATDGTIAVVAAVLILRLRWSVLRTLGACALLGFAAVLAGLPVS